MNKHANSPRMGTARLAAARHRQNEPRCDAVVGYAVDERGFHPCRCHQWKGLREAVAPSGLVLHYCPAPGHRVQVQAKARRSA